MQFALWVLLSFVLGATILLGAVAFVLGRNADNESRELVKRVMRLPWRSKLRLVDLLAHDQTIPIWVRAIPGSLVLSLGLPIDLVPDFIPLLGQLDDALVLLVGVGLLLRFIPSLVLERHLASIERAAIETALAEPRPPSTATLEAGSQRHRFTMSVRPLATLLLVAFTALLTGVAVTGRAAPGDVVVARFLQDIPRAGGLEWAADLLARRPIELAFWFVGALAALHRRQTALVFVAFAALIAMGASPVIKDLVERGRPTATQVIIREPGDGYAFPSGHAMAATLLFGYAALCALSLAPRMVAWLVALICLAAVALIGFDRVYDGAHWPSDVLAAVAIGVLVLIAFPIPSDSSRRTT